MLLDQPFNLEECWQEVPFVLFMGERLSHELEDLYHTSAVLIGSVKLFPP
jgi:hypothetical protein